MGEFVAVGSANEVAEAELASFSAGSRRIAVARVAGTLYAFDDLCTHAMCSLAYGELEGATVVCPCHFGQFDLATGEVLGGPPAGPIQVYPVKVEAGKLLIEI